MGEWGFFSFYFFVNERYFKIMREKKFKLFVSHLLVISMLFCMAVFSAPMAGGFGMMQANVRVGRF